MQTIGCPTCGEPMPDTALYCTRCGNDASLTDSETTIQLRPLSTNKKSVARPPIGRRISEALRLEPVDANATLIFRLFHKSNRARLLDEDLKIIADEDLDDEIMEQRATWQKIVEPRTPATLPVVASQHLKERGVKHLWSNVLPDRRSPRNFFWFSLLALVALVSGGAFGIALTFGREAPKPAVQLPSLLATPETIALGGIITLRGTHFTPGGQIILSRDKNLTLTDTGNASSQHADASGSFSDTIVVDPAWLAGNHSLYATNVQTHQEAASLIAVTGQSALQGPPHLLLSATSLDLGAGDQVTNASKLLAISNAGGGQINWQASIDQSWLQITPKSGTITSGSHISLIVAGNRSALDPGNYQAQITFTSNTEEVKLGVIMQVIPLQPVHEAVLQVSTPVLNFSSVAGDAYTQRQVISVNNPGVQPLTWNANISLQDGFGWLFVEQNTGYIEPGGTENITVSVNGASLTQGVYRGTIVFANQGSQDVQGSPESVYVTLSVAPRCTLTFSSNNLSFTGTVGQTPQATKSLKMGVAQGCGTGQDWSATIETNSGGNWLSLNQSSGSTLTTLQVTTNITGLAAGKYSGSLTFAGSAGSQLVSVSLTVNPVPPVPCGATATSALALQGTAGDATSNSQAITVSTTGTCKDTLNWTTSSLAITPAGGTWLSASTSGTLTQTATATIAVQATLSGLFANTYTGTVTITVTDASTSQTIGTFQVAVTLTVLPQCTLQPVSSSTLDFAATAGSDPTVPDQSVTLSLTGNCSGDATIALAVSDSTWLTVTPASTSLSSGSQDTFTITVASASLVAGTYTNTITLTASGPTTLVGSPQTITVTLTVT